MKKTILALLVLMLPLELPAEKEVVRDVLTKIREPEQQDPLTIRALARLEKRLDIKFNIAFPATFDVDAYRKRPLALLNTNGSKVCVSRPVVNPYDEPHTVEWMIGPADPKQLANQSIDCAIDLDEQGDFTRLNLIADWAGDGGNHQLVRGEGESGTEFFQRARLTYQARANKAKDPAAAILYLTAFAEMAATIQALRKEEDRAVPGAAPN